MLSSNDFIRSWYCYRQMTKIPTVFLKDQDWSSPSDSLLLHCHTFQLKGMDRLPLKFSKVQGKNVLSILLRGGGTTSSVNKGCLSRGSYIITQVILAFWLVLAHDLLEDRRIDEDSARFKFFWISWILNLNNQSVRFILMLIEIDHSQVPLSLSFKASPNAKLLSW